MIYLKHYTLLFHLMICLPAFHSCYTSNDPSDLTPISAKVPYKPCTLYHQAVEEDSGMVDDAPRTHHNLEHQPAQQLATLLDHKKNNIPFDFETTIQLLRKVADAKRGIRWHLSGDRLIREVVDSGNSLYAAEDYAVQIVNIYRAAKKICGLYEKDGTPFAKMAHEFMKQYMHHEKETENFWIQEVKNINKVVVSTLHQMVFPGEEPPSVNEKLRLAENYVGLDDTHYNVTTTFQVENKKFGLEDTKWLKLTEKQKLAFTNRQSADWYRRLDPFEQKLIDAYLDKFLDGSHYIPTQIRNIPGCRNAYQKRILAYDTNNNPTTLGCYYHSGALVSPTQWKDESITQDNWEQIQQYTKNIEVISLNHNLALPYIPFVGNLGEKHIVEGTRDVVGDKQFMYIPINITGTATTPMFKPQVHRLLEESTSVYNSKYPVLCESFTGGNKEDRQTNIEAITDPKDKRYFKKLQLLKEAAENSDIKNKILHNGPQVADNYYANIASDYITCKAILGQSTCTNAILFSCKSGKDRTGFMSGLVDGNIICMHDPSLDIDKGTKVYSTLAYAAHQQFLASVNGGMVGRFGMKPVRHNEVSRAIANQLFPKAALSTLIELN